MPSQFDPDDQQALARAEHLLERVSLSQRLVEYLGRPVDFAITRLPAPVRRQADAAAYRAMQGATEAACRSLGSKGGAWKKLHICAVVGAGAAGGFFGLPGLAVELPVSTMLILRSVAQIAREQGEDLATPESRLACLEVFALGGNARQGEAASSLYLNTRLLLAQNLRLAAAWLAGEAAGLKVSPALLALTRSIATRFSLVVEEKLLAGALPLVGAAGGAVVNGLFISLFQEKAQGHFIYRRLERAHGAQAVAEAYSLIRTGHPTPGRQ